MNRRKKIMFFIPSLAGGGAEKVLVNLVNNMDLTKFDITVHCLFANGINEKYLSNDITYKTVFKKTFRANIHIFKLFTPKQLFKYMVKDEYDIIVSYLQGPTTRILTGCVAPNTKIISWVHTEIKTQKDLMKNYRSERELIKCLKAFDSTVFVSKVAKKAFETNVLKESNYTVLYNTNEVQKILQLAKKEVTGFDSKIFNLISSGRFSKEKNFERLIFVLEKLIKDDKIPVHLYLLGNGKMQSQYEVLAKQLGIEGSITYLGYQNNPYKYVKQADVFVCSSLQEGFSTAVSESIIVGTPVITTDCSGMKEILGENNEYGIICDNDTEALYQSVAMYLKDEVMQKKYKQKAIERKSLFDTKKSVKAVEDYLLSF
ncbi:MAG: glycosyltransferase [Culicoidibacterales bacterium]